MGKLVWIVGVAVVVVGLLTFVTATTDDEPTVAAVETTEPAADDTAVNDDVTPRVATNDLEEEGANDVLSTQQQDVAATPEVDMTAEGSADATEVATTAVGAASNAATDAAIEEIAEGDAPTNEDVVAEARDLAEAEGTVGAVAAYQAETFDPTTVFAGLSSSDLDTTVQMDLAADLEAAMEEDDESRLEAALADIREALEIN